MAPSLLERQALRTRNGLAHLAGLRAPEVAQTPRDLVWQRETARLWRYRTDDRSVKVPLLIVHSLISKSYILDLLPENSMVRFLVGEGFDVYLLDWEPAGPADAENTLETYVADLVPPRSPPPAPTRSRCSATATAACSRSSPRRPAPTTSRSATSSRSPRRATSSDRLPVRHVPRGPARRRRRDRRHRPRARRACMDAGFQSIKPTDQLVQPLNLWEQLWSADRTENFLALNGWTRDQVPFPGATFRQTVELLIRDNRLLERRAAVRRRHRAAQGHQAPVPEHLLRAGHDRARAVGRAARPGLVGSRDASELQLETGHVGLVAGRYAEEVARPAIADWIRRHSANTQDFAAGNPQTKENGDRHTARAAAA